MNSAPRTIVRHLIAAALYVALAVYLYQPRFATFTDWQWLIPVNSCVGALGVYALSRRWVGGFTGALLAGLVYGFGPFFLGLTRVHPSAGLLAGGVPWLFVPATILGRRFGKALGLPLLLAPFVAIVLFSHLSAGQRLFAAPLHAEVRLADLVGFVAPLAMLGRSTALLGLYHVPMAALVLGVVMMWKARRYSIFIVLLAGFVMTFSHGFLSAAQIARLGVSPILWVSIPMLWCAVLSGIGLHGLIEAGFADRKWILAAVITLGVLAIVALLLAIQCFQVLLGLGDGYARLFVQAAMVYLLGALATGIIFLLTHMKLRVHWLRWAILCTAMGVDIFLGARYLVDRVL
ncbi:MAG TPA: hypothetical protein PKH24_05170 [Sedimentisphaerales bacterium]|jgi:hypothetical protein|nr:hypothetical protein [Sedimentisphaerales bacterium]HNU31493.1 hypothetical protein [Sedimentisphaerales bacterium]